jgi:K+-sensing histidine kinase KdpD
VEPRFESAKSTLASADVPAQNIETHLVVLRQREHLLDEIVEAAKKNDCRTVVVGRTAYPWIQEIFHSHLGEKLLSASADFSVRVVD